MLAACIPSAVQHLMVSNRVPSRLRFPAPSRVFFGWWIVLATVGINFFFSIGYYQGFQAFFLPIEREFGWTRTEMAGAFALRQLEGGFMSPIIGVLCDRFGPRKVIAVSVVLGGLGIMATGFVDSLWTFYLAFAIAAAGGSGAGHSISWAIVIANWFRRLRGRAMGLAFLGPVFGGPCTILVVLLEESLGWRNASILLGIVVIVTCLPLAMLARLTPERYGQQPDGGPAPEGAAAIATNAAERVAEQSAGLTTKQALRTPAFWLVAALFGIHSLGVSGVMVHVVALFESIGFSIRDGAVVLGLIFFFSGIGRVSAGALLDALDHRLVLIGILAVQAVVFVFVPFIGHEWWHAILFTLCFGSAFGATVPARPLLIRALFGNRAYGTVNGLAQGMSIVPAMIGPLLMGQAFDLSGSYTPALIAFAVITGLMIPAPLLLRSPLAARDDR